MSKLTKRIVIFAAAMVMMLASSLTVFAKENEAIPRIVDNVMYVDEGSNNVWIYGVAVSIAGGNKTDIVPNNPTKKIDVMANGQVFKQLDGVVLLKDEKKDRVFLEAGSVVIEAPAITDKALATLKANIAKNGVDSIAAAQIAATSADKSALAYGIVANGKAVMTSGEELSQLLKTNANYVSILEAYEKAVEAAKEAASASQETTSDNVPVSCPSSEPVTEYRVVTITAYYDLTISVNGADITDKFDIVADEYGNKTYTCNEAPENELVVKYNTDIHYDYRHQLYAKYKEEGGSLTDLTITTNEIPPVDPDPQPTTACEVKIPAGDKDIVVELGAVS